MKLYLWRDVLRDYTPGIAFAIAGSPDEARGLIIRAVTDGSGYCDGSDFAADPEAHDLSEPFAAYVTGGG